ncbi:hypothetical protein B0H13DRAFT_1917230 [Mycena leptocephala]|nr:hypothetical protein B0H13DRAFT_1917230 [Mycena leptocephala]
MTTVCRERGRQKQHTWASFFEAASGLDLGNEYVGTSSSSSGERPPQLAHNVIANQQLCDYRCVKGIWYSVPDAIKIGWNQMGTQAKGFFVTLLFSWVGAKQKGDKETLYLCPDLVPTCFRCIGNCLPDVLVIAPSVLIASAAESCLFVDHLPSYSRNLRQFTYPSHHLPLFCNPREGGDDGGLAGALITNGDMIQARFPVDGSGWVHGIYVVHLW